VLVFETGLPTRYYFNRTEVHLEVLEPSDTVSSCPYKGQTSAYWSVRLGDRLVPDLAWAYDFPTRQLLPIAGLVAFYNEKVDIAVDGESVEGPTTHFSERAGRGARLAQAPGCQPGRCGGEMPLSSSVRWLRGIAKVTR
jgi:hypothetical protein